MDGRTIIFVGLVALFAFVAGAMCVGLASDDDDDSRRARPRDRSDVPVEDESAELEQTVESTPPEVPEETEEEGPRPGVRGVRGVVLGLDDEPVEDAEVVVEGDERARDVTDRNGIYLMSGVSNIDLVLLVSAPGYAAARAEIADAEPGGEQEHDIELEIGETAAGQVVDERGDPVYDAEVRCADRKRDKLRTQSDRRGRFELPAGAVGCQAVAEHQSHGASPRVLLSAGPDNIIALIAPGSIEGIVVDENNRPLTSFQLSLVDHPYRQTFSHPRGRFKIPSLAQGEYLIEITSPRHAPAKSKRIRVDRGEAVRGVRIVLRPSSAARP